VAYSIRLTRSQIDFLRGLENANQWLRETIDQARVKDVATLAANRTILIAQQIEDVNGQIAVLEDDPILAEARHEMKNRRFKREALERHIEHAQEFIAHPEKWGPPHGQLHIIPGTKDAPGYTETVYSVWVPSARDLSSDTIESTNPDELPKMAMEKAQANLSKLIAQDQEMLEQERKPAAIIGAFEQQIQALQAKRQALEQELVASG